MSKGSKKQKGRAAACVPAGAGAPARQVWLVMTEKDSREQDARDLYQAAHLRPCLVLVTHACHVRADPSHDPATLRELIGLARFIQWKCSYALVRGAARTRDTVAGFATWPPPDACRDHHDPRVLPLHVFDPAAEWAGLDSASGTEAFEREYPLRSGSRVDVRGHVWEQPSARHGTAGPDRAALTIAGTRLPQGYHWDVQRARGRGRIVSESAVRLLTRENAYVNVYPNGHLRGEKARGARLVLNEIWPRRGRGQICCIVRALLLTRALTDGVDGSRTECAQPNSGLDLIVRHLGRPEHLCAAGRVRSIRALPLRGRLSPPTDRLRLHTNRAPRPARTYQSSDVSCGGVGSVASLNSVSATHQGLVPRAGR